MRHKTDGFTLLSVCLISLFFLVSCGPYRHTRIDIDRDIKIPKEPEKAMTESPTAPKIPDFSPVAEDITPLKTRIVNISARSTPLREVLHVIAEASSLNLVMEKGVDPEAKINLTLKNVTAEYALNTIFSSVDYFYTVKENMLVVKAMDTFIFELGHPALEQKYAIDVGGDILSGTSSSGGSGGGSSSTSGIKGNITQNFKADETAYKFWDTIERSIANLLRISAAGSPAALTESSPSFTVNRLTGIIMVTASKRNIEKVERYINNVRMVISRQVLVEAKIIEVTLTDNLKFGIDWSYIAGKVNLGTTNFAGVVPSSGSMVKIAATWSNFSPVLQALEEQGEVRILSNPRINIMNGQTALLSVGRNQSYISKVDSTTTTGVTPIQTYSIQTGSVLSGIMIGIVPYINENGEISLTITPIISNLVKMTPSVIGATITSSQVTMQLPTIDLRELSTTVKVWNGQMIIIGGLIDKTESLQDSQVPFLGNIPVLGYLFKSRSKEQFKRELVVLLQPFLVSK
ncbi:MAG: hypothetical protein C0392_01140 [Syntrophus sp. (in: bacteria)]|nr:hypothetical protein [Syntrophus sp. (in: bacteria)]